MSNRIYFSKAEHRNFEQWVKHSSIYRRISRYSSLNKRGGVMEKIRNREALEKKIKDILQTRFGEICTSSGVSSGYQLSHQVGGQFTSMIVNAIDEDRLSPLEPRQ